MKKHLLALLIATVAIGVTAKAQIQQGYYLIGGNLSNISVGFSDGTPFSLTITPKVAWFRNDKLAIGGYANLGIATEKGAGTTFNYGVGPLARYYFGSSDVSTTTTSARRSTRFFLEGTVGIQGQNTSGGSSTNGLGLGIGPGVAYFINQNIALEGLLKLDNTFGFGNNGSDTRLNFGLGFQIYLPRGTMRNQAQKVTQ